MLFRRNIVCVAAAVAGFGAAAALAAAGVDIRLTLDSVATSDDDLKNPYFDVVLSYVFRGAGATGQRSRYLGPITDQEKVLLPESKAGGYKVYTSPPGDVYDDDDDDDDDDHDDDDHDDDDHDHDDDDDDDDDDEEEEGSGARWNDTIVLRNVPDDATLTLRLWERRKIRANKWLGDADVNLGPLVSGGMQPSDGEQTVVAPVSGGVGDVKLRVALLGPTSWSDAALVTRREGPIKWRRYHNKFVEPFVEGVSEALFGGDKGYYVYSVDLHNSEKIFGSIRKVGKPDHPTIIKNSKPYTGPLRKLYHRFRHSILNGAGEFGELKDARGFFDVFDWGRGGKRFTFVVRDGFIRFSETGFDKRLDDISKHIVLADGNHDVMFAGEMFVVPADRLPASAKADAEAGRVRGASGDHRLQHAPFVPLADDPRADHMTTPPSLAPGQLPVPEGTELPVLVIDNGSGTFGPSKDFLPQLKQLLLANFPDMKVLAIDQNDPRMHELKIAAEVPLYDPKAKSGKIPVSPPGPPPVHVVLPEGRPVNGPL
ncbi:MAG: hypothetical protein BJ554DRAFT_233 [Olpidium bornovanus]|uniref:Uncharacterized protein n=1 Tax=Olpidium bornovanus TaxID=278681 RepID=A0A8H8DIS0_9FUNG|nr:MAG: hypothetical protein BJ554DRAFT_233 [Olpidium bornovanus]